MYVLGKWEGEEGRLVTQAVRGAPLGGFMLEGKTAPC